MWTGKELEAPKQSLVHTQDVNTADAYNKAKRKQAQIYAQHEWTRICLTCYYRLLSFLEFSASSRGHHGL